MKNRTLIGILIPLVVGSTSSCEILGLEDEVKVRLRNGSNLVYDEAALLLPEVILRFSNLQPGEETSYQVVGKAYDYASAEVVVGADTARLQVIDYVGEKPLDGGRYTYILRFFPGAHPTLGMDFERGS